MFLNFRLEEDDGLFELGVLRNHVVYASWGLRHLKEGQSLARSKNEEGNCKNDIFGSL